MPGAPHHKKIMLVLVLKQSFIDVRDVSKCLVWYTAVSKKAP